MGQREGYFWRNTVRPKLDAFTTVLKYRIETSTVLGFPDTILLVEGRTSLVELKSKPTFEKGLGTTAKQRQFLSGWQGAGGNAYLLARVGDSILFLDGAHAGLVMDFGWYRDHSLVFGRSTVEFDWEAMYELLAGRGLRTSARLR